MLKQFYFKQFNLALIYGLVLLDLWIGPYQVLTLRAKVDQGQMVMKEYSAFPKVPA